jgi:anti-anti-sigma factor
MPQDELLKVSTLGPIRLVELFLPNDLDSTEFDRLNDGLVDVFTPGEGEDQQGARWIIDLTHVAYLGSAGLGLLVNIRQRVKSANGQLALCQMNPRLHQIFRTCSLERLFTITRTREDAVRALR